MENCLKFTLARERELALCSGAKIFSHPTKHPSDNIQVRVKGSAQDGGYMHALYMHIDERKTHARSHAGSHRRKKKREKGKEKKGVTALQRRSTCGNPRGRYSPYANGPQRGAAAQATAKKTSPRHGMRGFSRAGDLMLISAR